MPSSAHWCRQAELQSCEKARPLRCASSRHKLQLPPSAAQRNIPASRGVINAVAAALLTRLQEASLRATKSFPHFTCNATSLCTYAALHHHQYKPGWLNGRSEVSVSLPRTGACAGSVTLGLWAVKGTCSMSVLLLHNSGRNSLRSSRSAKVSWLGLCGPGASPCSPDTS